MAAELIQLAGDVSVADKEGNTPIHWAIMNNNTEIAAELIRRGADVNATNEEGNTPLHCVMKNNTEIATELIRRGADVNAANKRGDTPLYWATRRNNTEIAAELIRRGAYVNAANKEGDTPLHWATYHNNTAIATELIRRGADVKATNEVGDTPLHWATWNNNTEIATELIHCGADVKATNEVGYTPLYWATSYNNTEIAAELIRRGADVNAANKGGETPLLWAAYRNNTEIATELIQRGADVNAANVIGDTSLCQAIRNNNKEAAATLLNSNADFFIENKIGTIPLVDAHSHSDKEIFLNICQRIQCNPLSLNYNGDPYFHAAVKFCFNEILDISKSSGYSQDFVLKMRGLNGNSPLHYWATAQFNCGQRVTEFGERLIELGAQLNARNDKDETPLHVATSWRAVDLLLGKGAWPNVKSEPNGDTPLLTRANRIKESSAYFYDGFCPGIKPGRGDYILIKEWQKISEKGMDPLITNYNGVSLLKILIDKKNFELANALVSFQTRSTANSKLTNGDTILHIICAEAKDELQTTIDNLLKPGVNVNCPNATKQTALHLVCKGISSISGDKENVASTMLYWTVSRLLAFGADPTLKDCDGVSCFDIAKCVPELSKLLEKPIDINTIPQLLKWSDPKSKNHKHVIAQVVRNQNSIQVESFHYHKTPIGSGGFGHVFAGVDSRDGREIAVKRIEKHRLTLPHDEREISTLTEIQDCGEIVRYHCHHKDDQFVFLILDLMEGTLIDYLSSEYRDSSNDVTLCRDVMNGLSFLHQNKVLHRDIKPGNILYKLCPRICLKLADFGLSSKVTASGTFSVMHTAAGTRCWMAPELLLQTGGIKHTESSDVFSCGLILHFLIAEKRHPFINPSSPKLGSLAEQSEAEQAILNCEPFLHKDLSPEARDLLQTMMCKNESDRPKASDTLHHPFFWSDEKRKNFVLAVGNQPCIQRPRSIAGTVLSPVEQELENTLGTRREVFIGWENFIPSLYSEMTVGRRLYDTSSAVELVRFVRNCYAHASDRNRTLQVQTFILKHEIYKKFPTLVIDVYRAVMAHGWNTVGEIENVLED